LARAFLQSGTGAQVGWNQNHVEEAYDPAFLGRFERLVSEMGRAA